MEATEACTGPVYLHDICYSAFDFAAAALMVVHAFGQFSLSVHVGSVFTTAC